MHPQGLAGQAGWAGAACPCLGWEKGVGDLRGVARDQPSTVAGSAPPEAAGPHGAGPRSRRSLAEPARCRATGKEPSRALRVSDRTATENKQNDPGKRTFRLQSLTSLLRMWVISGKPLKIEVCLLIYKNEFLQ